MRVIDLRGPQGNAIVLMGLASTWAKQLEWPKAQIDKLLTDMRSGDYNNLLTCFEQAFPYIDFKFKGDPRNPNDPDNYEDDDE
jgi:hypothetical protein